jgi:hypothetical protein
MKSDAEEDLLRALTIVIGEGTYISPRINDGMVKKLLREAQGWA